MTASDRAEKVWLTHDQRYLLENVTREAGQHGEPIDVPGMWCGVAEELVALGLLIRVGKKHSGLVDGRGAKYVPDFSGRPKEQGA